jgi:hypothetical protein
MFALARTPEAENRRGRSSPEPEKITTGESAESQPGEWNDHVLAALQARLEVLEKEIDRLSRLASEADDVTRQQQYWDLAQDLQRDARKIRDELRRARARSLKP